MSHAFCEAVTPELREAIEKSEEAHLRFDRKIPKRLYRLTQIAAGETPTPIPFEEQTGSIVIDPFPTPKRNAAKGGA